MVIWRRHVGGIREGGSKHPIRRNPTVASWRWSRGVWYCRASDRLLLSADPSFYSELPFSIFLGSDNILLCWWSLPHSNIRSIWFYSMALWSQNTDAKIFLDKMVILNFLTGGELGVTKFINSLHHLYNCIYSHDSYVLPHTRFLPHIKNLKWRFLLHNEVTDDGANFEFGSTLDRHVSREKFLIGPGRGF